MRPWMRLLSIRLRCGVDLHSSFLTIGRCVMSLRVAGCVITALASIRRHCCVGRNTQATSVRLEPHVWNVCSIKLNAWLHNVDKLMP